MTRERKSYWETTAKPTHQRRRERKTTLSNHRLPAQQIKREIKTHTENPQHPHAAKKKTRNRNVYNKTYFEIRQHKENLMGYVAALKRPVAIPIGHRMFNQSRVLPDNPRQVLLCKTWTINPNHLCATMLNHDCTNMQTALSYKQDRYSIKLPRPWWNQQKNRMAERKFNVDDVG